MLCDGALNKAPLTKTVFRKMSFCGRVCQPGKISHHWFHILHLYHHYDPLFSAFFLFGGLSYMSGVVVWLLPLKPHSKKVLVQIHWGPEAFGGLCIVRWILSEYSGFFPQSIDKLLRESWIGYSKCTLGVNGCFSLLALRWETPWCSPTLPKRWNWLHGQMDS